MWPWGLPLLLQGMHAWELSHVGRVRLFATLWTVACQAPLSMGFSRQEYWRELPFQSPGDLPNPGINPDFLPCRQILYHLNHQENPPGTMNHISYFSLSIPSVLGRIINEQNTRVKICFCEKPLKCCHKWSFILHFHPPPHRHWIKGSHIGTQDVTISKTQFLTSRNFKSRSRK